MFESAITRLTMWYVAIIMAISLLFSAWVYNAAVNELRGGLQHGAVRITIGKVDLTSIIDDELLASRQRLVVNLVLFNTAVLVVGAGASYLLARRTLRPIEESVEAQNRFTADASHELRTPLAAMKAEIEVALRDKNLKTQEARELLASNLEEIDRLSGLAEGLLTLARSDASPEMEVVDLSEVTAKVVKRLQPLAHVKDVHIALKTAPVKVRADYAHTDKIIGIIVDNAIKYSGRGQRVTVAVSRHDGYGLVAIDDKGRGIKEADLPHIFDRFYRADSARSSNGYGLGLAIAKKLAGDMRGFITATSEVGKGSSFELRLPKM